MSSALPSPLSPLNCRDATLLRPVAARTYNNVNLRATHKVPHG